MNGSESTSPGISMRWLLSGVLTGVIVTFGIVVVIASAIRGDAPTEAAGPPAFAEETDSSGIAQVYDGEFHFFVGGGVAVFDCDDDRLPDLYLAGGSSEAGLYRNRSEVGGALRFEREQGAVTDMREVTGAYPLDVDSDGVTDLAVLRVGRNVMLRGLGDCLFEPANDEWGIDGGEEWTAAFSATWEQDATFPTLVFGNYLALDENDKRTDCADHVFFRPGPKGYGHPVTLSPGWCTLSVLFSDWSGTGQTDLRMTNDRHYYTDGEEQLWEIRPGESPRPYGREDGWQEMEIWGMGIASRDITGDSRPEIFLTSQGDNKLQTLSDGADGPTYEDIALERGATAHRPFAGDTTMPSTAWHAEFEDVNNDGFVDLFVTKGNVEAQPDFATRDPNDLLIGRADGTFTEGAGEAGLIDFARSRGAALTDLNLDGLIDVVVVDRREPVKIWRNLGSGGETGAEPMGSWVQLALHQTAPNVDAIGAVVEARLGNVVQRREVTVGGGHAGGQLGFIHFGLGEADEIDVRVNWPDGEVGVWMTVDANQLVVIDRAEGVATPWQPVQD